MLLRARGDIERCRPIAGLLVGGGACLEQQTHHLGVAVVAGEVQRRQPMLRLRVR